MIVDINKLKKKELIWVDTPYKKKIRNTGWSEDALLNDDVIFRMFYDNDLRGVYLLDMLNEVSYEVPFGAKLRGYKLANKLYVK